MISGLGNSVGFGVGWLDGLGVGVIPGINDGADDDNGSGVAGGAKLDGIEGAGTAVALGVASTGGINRRTVLGFAEISAVSAFSSFFAQPRTSAAESKRIMNRAPLKTISVQVCRGFCFGFSAKNAGIAALSRGFLPRNWGKGRDKDVRSEFLEVPNIQMHFFMLIFPKTKTSPMVWNT